MASSAGPRAAGTDGGDHKFRQRVDDHYRHMASAKKTIRAAARLQLVAALGFAAVAGPIATRAADSTPMAALTAASAALAILAGAAWKSAGGACGSQQVEKRAAAYAGSNGRLLGLLVGAAVAGAAAVAQPDYLPEAAELPPPTVLYAAAAVGATGLVGCVLGSRGASTLLDAFEMQRAKSKSK